MRNKYPGRCKRCGGWVKRGEGEVIVQVGGNLLRHLDCQPAPMSPELVELFKRFCPDSWAELQAAKVEPPAGER